MKGLVDESLRALLDVSVATGKSTLRTRLRVWIDTAFNGGLVMPREWIEQLGLTQASTTEAILADSKLVDLETFTCYLDWFGKTYRTQVIANEGDLPLLGTSRLANRKLTIDYQASTVDLL